MKKPIISQSTEEGFCENLLTKHLTKMNFTAQPSPSFSRQDKTPGVKITSQRLDTQKFYMVVKTFILVLNFIKSLRKNVFLRNQKTIRKNALFLIKDLVYFRSAPSDRKDTKLRQTSVSRLLEIMMKYMPLIHHSNKFVLLWKRIDLITQSILFIFIPFNLAFVKETDTILHNVCYSLIMVFCVFYLCDIILKMNVSRFAKGVLITKKSLIIEEYLKTEAPLDFISIFPLFLSMFNISRIVEKSILDLLFFLCFSKNCMLSNLMNRCHEIRPSERNIRTIIKSLLFLAHFLACIWYFISDLFSPCFQSSWAESQKQNTEFLLEKYINSLLFIVETLSFQSHSIQGPQNYIEKILYILIILGTNLTFFLIMKELIHGNKRKDPSSIIRDFLNRTDLSSALKNEISRTLNRKVQKKNILEAEQRNEEILSELPDALRVELLPENEFKFLKELDIFRKIPSKIFLQIKYLVKKRIFFKGEQIFTPSDRNTNLFFIKSGKVSLCLNSSEYSSIVIQKSNQIFNQIEFFSGFHSSYTAVCQENVVIYSLNRENTIDLLRTNQKSFEKFCEIRDKIVFSEKLEDLKINCSACGSNQHSELKCPYVHFISPKKQNLLQIPLMARFQNQANERESFIRRRKWKSKVNFQWNSLLLNEILSPRIIDNPSQNSQNVMNFHSEMENFLDESISSNTKAGSFRGSIDIIPPDEKMNYFPEHQVDVVVRDYNCVNTRNSANLMRLRSEIDK